MRNSCRAFVALLLFIGCRSSENTRWYTCLDIQNVEDSVNRGDLFRYGYQQLSGLKVQNSMIYNLAGDSARLFDLAQRGTKAIVLDFWFIGCAPCEAHLPHLIELKKQYDEEVIFISLANNSIEQLQEYIPTKVGFSWDLYLADHIKDDLCVTGYPSYFVLNNQFEIQNMYTGGSTDPIHSTEDIDRLKSEIDRLM